MQLVKNKNTQLWDFLGGPDSVLPLQRALIPGQGTKIPHAMWCSQNFFKKNQKHDYWGTCKNYACLKCVIQGIWHIYVLTDGTHHLDQDIHHNRLPRWLSGKKSACQCRSRRPDPWVRKISWSRKWQLTLLCFPVNFHSQRSLVGYSPWDSKEHTHISIAPHIFLCPLEFLPLSLPVRTGSNLDV